MAESELAFENFYLRNNRGSVDAAMTPPGKALGRISGFALLSLVGVCWPRRRTNGALLPAIGALTLFSALTATYLLYLGIGGQLVGLLLWPAAATHFVFAILLAQAWITRRTP